VGLTIFSTVCLILLAVAAARVNRDWLHPAALFPIVWAANLIVALVLAPENIVSATGPLWILLNSVFAVGGAILGSIVARSSYGLRQRQDGPQAEALPASNRKLRNLTLICIVAGVAYVLAVMHMQGIGLGRLFSPQEVFKIAAQMSFARYTGRIETSKALQLLLGVAYFAPMIGGTLMVRRTRSLDRNLALFSLLPAMLAFFVQSTKSSVLWGVIMWFAGYFTTRVFFGCTLPRVHLTRRAMIVVFSTLPLLVGVILTGDALRSGARSKAVKAGAALVGERTKTYLTGHIAALSSLIDHTDLDAMAHNPGEFTIAGIYELAEVGTRQAGVTGSGIFIPTGSTNVFTYFWDLIADFTAPGSLAIVLLLSAVGGFAYEKVAERKSVWSGALAACYSTMFCGFTCMFNYNSLILAFILYGLFCARPWNRKGEPAWGE
jgi:oligosaccharide repeat unit polymerase